MKQNKMSKIVLESIAGDVFVCGTCKTVFTSLEIFLEHKKTCKHVTEEKIDGLRESNSIDNASAVRPLLTGDVLNEQTVTTDISCKECKKPFKKMKSLLVHMKSHNDRSYQCLICGRNFMHNSHLQRHIISHKVWPVGISETTVKSLNVDLLSYSCPYCDSLFSSYTKFRAHLKTHLSYKKFKCIQGDCVGLFESVETLLNHVTSVHSQAQYICHICQKHFDALEEIAAHSRNHKDNIRCSNELKLYKCNQCDATFKKLERLTLHTQFESHKKVCIHCNKVFASDKRLRLHLQIHKKLQPFICNVCGSSFRMKKYLSTHMLKHGDRQFICSICKFKFKRYDLLQRHLNIHYKRKLLKCPFKDSLNCVKEFTRTDKLNAHIKYHVKNVSLVSKKHETDDPTTMEICILPLDVH